MATPEGAVCVDTMETDQSVGAGDSAPMKKRVPRRLIHYVDGTVEEEFSTDEEDEEVEPPLPPVDASKLEWPAWMWHYTRLAGTKSLAAADFCGEKLAWFLGITSPKYQSVIDEYHRLKEELEEEERQELAEKEAYMEERRQRQGAADLQETMAAMEMGEFSGGSGDTAKPE